MKTDHAPSAPTLRRALTLPLLVFYGVGVTVGAGIFALIGEILAIAGDHAPLAFLLAGAIAGATGLSYALLVRVFPRAGGEAVFVNRGIGPLAGQLVGIGVVVTGIVSSAVIALAFAGYAGKLVPLPAPVLSVTIVALLGLIAWWGVKESVLFAAAITLLEVGTLAVIVLAGVPLFSDVGALAVAFTPPSSLAALAPILSGAVVAFFAFIGFEDIENMAEETVDPVRTAPRAIFWTLGITVLLYVLLASIAVLAPGREAIAGSDAPLAVLFEIVTGMRGEGIAVIAAIAMVNGILVQIVMASRVLYGMAKEELLPGFLGRLDPRRRTPTVATATVALAVALLALSFPLLRLAELTSLVTLAVFAMVNFAHFRLAATMPEAGLRKWRWWGLGAASLCAGMVAWQTAQGLAPAH
jgi:amino acid transporter